MERRATKLTSRASALARIESKLRKIDAGDRRDLRHLKYLSPALRQTQTETIAARAKSMLPDDLMMTSAQLRTLAAARAWA